jgi:hypothetical protein
MNARLTRMMHHERRWGRAQRMRWICKAQERRESVATYFPMGGRLTLKVLAVVGFVFFVVRMWP